MNVLVSTICDRKKNTTVWSYQPKAKNYSHTIGMPFDGNISTMNYHARDIENIIPIRKKIILVSFAACKCS